MKDADIREKILAALQCLDGYGYEGQRGFVRENLIYVLDALEANPPLAEVEGEWLRGFCGLPATLFVTSAEKFQTQLDVPSRNSGYIPVTGTIRKKP